MSNENNGVVAHPEAEAPVVAAGLPAAPVEGEGAIPAEVFSRLKEHPGLLDVMTRAMNGESVSPQEMHTALTQAGVPTPGAPARVPRRPSAATGQRRPFVQPNNGAPQAMNGRPSAPQAPQEPQLPSLEDLLAQAPLDGLLRVAGLRLWNALNQTMPGCHLAITIAEEGVSTVILLPPDAELEEDEPFALANIQGEPDQLGEACGMAFDVADNALAQIRESLG